VKLLLLKSYLLERVASLSDEAFLAILYFWKEETHSWFSLLIARVYARMFNISPIDRSEALQLCAQMLEGLGSLPDDLLRQEYTVVYRAISQRLKGVIDLPPALLSPTGKSQHAHAHAIEILRSAAGEKRSGWLTEALQDRRGWTETTRFQLKDQSHSFGTSTYFLYVFPAVRLAIIAAGKEDDPGDPAAQFMKGRVQVNRLLAEHRRILSADYPVDHDRQQVALTAFKRQLEDTPYDERLWQCIGSLFLRIGDFAEAEKTLFHCLSMPSCSQESKANVYYDLACVYARLSKEVDCQRMLQISFQLRPINQFFRDWLSRDPDLERMREKAWFQALLEEEVNELEVNGL
jgi:tetratricopeptide (TPR) repeat protein